jgi:polygalacturonase
MHVEVIAITPRSLTLEIRNGEPFHSPWQHRVLIDGREIHRGHENVFVLHKLEPSTRYTLKIESNGENIALDALTLNESYRLDVCAFGAVGDGTNDDTAALQAAIVCCPRSGTVLVPAGDWLSGPLFLKSNMRLELAHGARLLGHHDIWRWPLLPASLNAADNSEEIVLGSWEGHPAICHASLINAIDVHDIVIHGEGTIDGNANFDTWWSRPKTRFIGWRPRTILLANSHDVTIDGITLRNSPSWTLHALRSRDLRISAVTVEAPSDSPNTDGINPESCERVRIIGARVSTGDDCIGIKSGKRNPDGPPPPPSRDVLISNCLMQNGHGAIVIGSEMAGGVYDVLARDCLFRGTDRGFRIKTQRGRGRTAIVDGARIENVKMENVGTPFVVNSFYWCDPDGREPHVGDRNPRAVDDGTPSLRNLSIAHVNCTGAAHSAVHILGLPEAPIENVSIEDFRVRFDPAALPGYPDMAEGIEPTARQGIYLLNVRGITLRDIDIDGIEGPALIKENVE